MVYVNTTNVLHALAGTWSIFNNTLYNANGTIQPEDTSLGAFPMGHITYNLNGIMSAQLYNTRPEFRPTSITWPAKANDSDDTWALVGRHMVAYSGPFYLINLESETNGQVNHGPILVAAVQSWVNTTVHRNFTILEDGKMLVIKIVGSNGGLGLSYWNKLDLTDGLPSA